MQYIDLFSEKRDELNLDNIDYELIKKIASSLLMKYVIVVNEKEYRMCEIEFYIKSDQHNDKYTHGDKNQKSYGNWYFHRYPNGSYKSGTYKGMDLTLGNINTFFGILIRSVFDLDLDSMIEGPCKVVNLILEANGKFDVKGYMEDKKDPLSVSCIDNIYLKRVDNLPNEHIYVGPRIGLSDKFPDWKEVLYRFIIKKNYIKKGKKSLVLLQ